MTIRKLRAARVNTTTASTFVGQPGDIFYDEHTGQLKVSDGRTPGGHFIQLVVATSTQVGGIKAGPGANVSVDGTLTIDTAGLPLSIGDLDIVQANISTVNANQNLNLITNGSGSINAVGNLHVHTTTQNWYSNGDSPILEINDFGNVITNGNLITNGQTVHNGNVVVNGNLLQTGATTQIGPTIFIVAGTPSSAALEITGNTFGLYQTPVNTGVGLQVTGADGGSTVSRIYNDSIGQYALFAGRRFNGTISIPTQVLANQDIVRYAGTGYATGGWPTIGPARMVITASENLTSTNQGGRIEFWATANGTVASTSIQRVATIDPALGVTATGFVTPTTTINNGITTTGNITAGNIITKSYGNLFRPTRNAGLISDGGTLTVDFYTDSIIYCTWTNGMTINYQNYKVGAVVRVICAKTAGSGTDTLSLDGITGAQTSTGGTTISGSAGQTYFIELTCVGTTIGDVFAKI